MSERTEEMESWQCACNEYEGGSILEGAQGGVREEGVDRQRMGVGVIYLGCSCACLCVCVWQTTTSELKVQRRWGSGSKSIQSLQTLHLQYKLVGTARGESFES